MPRKNARRRRERVRRLAWPKKTREPDRDRRLDATEHFKFRLDDVVIDTFGKSGTTWMGTIVGQPLLGAPDGVSAGGSSPWLDMRIFRSSR